MDAFTLVARLVLNKSDFNTSLAGVETTLNSQTNKDRFSKWGVAMGNLAADAFRMAFTGTSKFLKSVFETGMDFDEMMSDVYSISSATEEQQTALRTTAIELGRTTKFTATEVGQAYHYMAMAGWESEEMLAAIAGVMDLAAASGEDLATVSDIVTDSMTAFHIPVDGFTNGLQNAVHYANLLAQASARSNTNVGLMGETFKYVAPVAGSFGMKAEDVAVAVGAMADNGIKASQAGTTLRAILTRIATNAGASDKKPGALDIVEKELGTNFFETEKSKEAAKEYIDFLEKGLAEGHIHQGDDGLYSSIPTSFENEKDQQIYEQEWIRLKDNIEQNKTRDLVPFLRDLRKQFKTIKNDDKRAYYAKQIAGQNAISGFLALMDYDDEKFESLVNELQSNADQGEGAAHRMAETKLDNLKGDIVLLNSALDGLKILVSDEYKGKLRGFVEVFTEEVGKMSESFQEGGFSGMLINLTDWIINGITDTLSNPEITVEGANDFGKALGDFVGHLVAKLIKTAPELISGLFTAGMNLAGGLVEGLFAGLFGTGEGTVAGMITGIQGEEEDAIKQAEKTSLEAQGIVSYMESLIEKYGDAATKSGEWATSLDRLEKLIPGITDNISAEGTALEETTQKLSGYIEKSKEKAIEDAKRAAIEKYRENYKQAQVDLGTAEVNRDIAKYRMDEIARELIDYIVRNAETQYQRRIDDINNSDMTDEQKRQELEYEQKDWAENYFANSDELFNAFQDGSLGIKDLTFWAYGAANELGESQDKIKTLEESFSAADQEYKTNVGSIKTLTEKSDSLAIQLEIAEKAVERMVEEMGSTVSGTADPAEHAAGNWFVPYNDYPALLHRGEAVLTASQARQFRENASGANLDISALTSAIVGAVQEGLRDAQVNAYLDGNRVTREVSRIMNDQMMLAR